ncbi:MAG: biotin-dependent carboxyltransferase family protein [bacterium]
MSILVERQGLFDTIHDAGRTGFRRYGVPTGGWFDKRHAIMANLLVGNAIGAACVEITQKSGLFLANSPLYVAVAGPCAVINHLKCNSEAREYGDTAVFWLNAGDRLEVRHPGKGCRSYLAVTGGGWQAKQVLGSHSSETRLNQGNLLQPAGQPELQLAYPSCRYFKSPFTDFISIENKLNYIPAIAFQPISETFTATEWQVLPQSNRVGIRLVPVHSCPGLSMAASGADRLSEPVIPGTVQWTGSELIILGVAGGTMGGYERIGQVIESDIPRLAQLRPGEKIQFSALNLNEARRRNQLSEANFQRKFQWMKLAISSCL